VRAYHRAVDATPDEALGLLRPALELALGVAREGATATPAIAPPRALRPVLRHAKLSTRALATVREVLESDDAFRSRVAAAASEEDLGELPYAWLSRRDGWLEQLRAAVDASAVLARAADEQKAERSARRRLDAAERRREEAEAEAARHRAAIAEVESQLAEARQQRRAAEDEARVLTASLSEVTETVEELEAALASASRAHRELQELLDDAHGRIDALIAERDEATARAERAEAVAGAARRQLGDRGREADQLRSGLARAVDEAAAAARHLGTALASAAAVLDQGSSLPASTGAAPTGTDRGAPRRSPSDLAPHPPGPGPLPGPGGRASGRAPDGGDRTGGSGRRPVPLPPATFDDSADAAAFLVGVPGMVLAVDGYNVTLSGWPDAELARQRRALVDRLAALGAQTGTEVRVFFDGAEDHQLPPPRGRARDAVRISFSAAGTDADEDIIAFVDDLPATRPVTVATSDRRVALEVQQRGANVISSAQLLAVLGRDAGR
jgi:predicted RNA-binding protein with PIN domain